MKPENDAKRAQLMEKKFGQEYITTTFVRAHDANHGINLEKAGATAVVPETSEPSLQLAAIVLAQAKLPMTDIATTINEFRTRHLSELNEVSYVVLSLTRSYGARVVEWATGIMTLIPTAALTEAEYTRFLQSLTDAAETDTGSSSSDSNINFLNMLEEVSDVCRRSKTVQEIVQGALRPIDLHFTLSKILKFKRERERERAT